MGKGRVFLVGAGPGDPGLITVKGLEALQKADAVLCDRLANRSLLKYVPKHCEVLDVGKQPNSHGISQDEINRLLVEKALEGKTVVRLKGGDPFVFGRGGEEAAALKQAGIPYDVVPGVTSAVAVPAYAGIPITHRDYGSSFAVVTGHPCSAEGKTAAQWEHLAKGVETLVILMGVSNLSFICDQLIRHGRSATTPVALIRWGTRVEQETLTGTLGDIAQKVKEVRFRPPAVIVVGEVVRERVKLDWHETKPLFGKRILVPRTRGGRSQIREQIEDLGGEAVVFPVARFIPSESLRTHLERESSVQWLSFASVQDAELFFRGLKEWGRDIRRWVDVKVAVWDPAAAEFLREKGVQPDISHCFESDSFELMESSVKPGETILHLRGRKSPKWVKRIQQRGCQVIEVETAVLQTLCEQAEQAAHFLREGQVDGIAFASSSTVRHFAKVMSTQRSDAKEWMFSIPAVCIGPETAAAAKEMGFRVEVAHPHTVQGLMTALARCLGGRAKVVM